MTTNIIGLADFNPDEPDTDFERAPDFANETLFNNGSVVKEQSPSAIDTGFGLDAAAIVNFQKLIQSNLPVVKEFPSWLLTTFPDETQLFTHNLRLDVYVYRVWLMSCWFNKTQGFFIHFRGQGAKVYNNLETSIHPKAELGHGSYNGEQTIRFYVKVEKDYDRLKELTSETIQKYTSHLAELPSDSPDNTNSLLYDQHKLMFLTGWWRRLNEIRENSSTSSAILARETFTKAGYQAYQDFYSKYRHTIAEKPAKVAYYQAYLDFQNSARSGDWLSTIDFAASKTLYSAEAVENLIKAFKVVYGNFHSEKFLKEERTYKDAATEKARKLLDKETLQRLLEKQEYEAIKLRIKQACTGNNLLNQWDYLVIFNAPAEALSHNLFDLLYGDAPMDKRFENWVTFLNPTKPRSWPAVTYFLMLIYPTNYLFVKPKPFREFLETVDSTIVWETRPAFGFYQKLLEMAQELLEILKPLEARDFVDVQSFIWVAKELDDIVIPVKSDDNDGNDGIDLGNGGEKPVEIAKPPVGNYQEPSFEEITKKVAGNKIFLQDGILRRYHLSLKTRGFVILSGLSGSGKTWLAQAYASAVGGESCLVSVAPNWTTNEDLLGYFSPLTGKYHDTAVSRFIRKADQAYNAAKEAGVTPTPYFLILDEMNLARVEYYFARFLSAMEIRARQEEALLI